jgi:hypothetical protein
VVNVPIKVDGVDVLPASEYNSVQSEIETLITSLGLTLDINILDQLRKAVSGYCRGLECKDTGSINTYVLSRANTNLIDFNNVYDGMVISFKTTNVNTGVSTVNFNSTGVRNIVINNTALTGGEIQANTYNFLTYNLANDNFELSALPLKSYVDSAIANITLQKALATDIRTGTDDSKYVTPLGLNQTVLGFGQTWQSPTRLAGVTYTNTTGRPIYILISVFNNIVINTTSELFINGTLTARVQNSSNSDDYGVLSAVIPNNSTYVYTVSTTAFSFIWRELR